jgi:hypothetical protein
MPMTAMVMRMMMMKTRINIMRKTILTTGNGDDVDVDDDQYYDETGGRR